MPEDREVDHRAKFDVLKGWRRNGIIGHRRGLVVEK
jgi:hypothetical protein